MRTPTCGGWCPRARGCGCPGPPGWPGWTPNPERVLELLELLKDDPTTLVRRSVANNLNDLGKVRPDLLERTCAAWLKRASAERRALVEHALRSAVKRGEAGALQLLGYGKQAAVSVEQVKFEPRRVTIGDRVRLSFVLRSESRSSQEVLVDLAVHFVKAGGRTAPKVFKLKRIQLPPGGQVELQSRISLAVHTTRVPRPGRHAVDVLVNGQPKRVGIIRRDNLRRCSRSAVMTRNTSTSVKRG